MTIAFSTDRNYVGLTAVAMTSLLQHNSGIRIVMLCNGVPAESNQFLADLCTRFGGTYESFDVGPRLRELAARKANGYKSFSTYARLFLPAFIPEGRVIYLDGDTLVCGDLSPLETLPLQGRACACACDCQRIEYKKMIGLPLDAPYYNTGVMVLDCAAWRLHDCTARVLAQLDKGVGRALFADQDLINLALHDDMVRLPPEYNFLPHYQMFRTSRDCTRIMGIPPYLWYSEAEYANARRAPVVHHFLGHTLGRPWTIQSRNPIRPEYRRIAALAGVPEVAEQSRPLDFGYRVQAWMWHHLPNALFVEACRAMYRWFFWSRYRV